MDDTTLHKGFVIYQRDREEPLEWAESQVALTFNIQQLLSVGITKEEFEKCLIVPAVYELWTDPEGSELIGLIELDFDNSYPALDHFYFNQDWDVFEPRNPWSLQKTYQDSEGHEMTPEEREDRKFLMNLLQDRNLSLVDLSVIRGYTPVGEKLKVKDEMEVTVIFKNKEK